MPADQKQTSGEYKKPIQSIIAAPGSISSADPATRLDETSAMKANESQPLALFNWVQSPQKDDPWNALHLSMASSKEGDGK
ncbi:unnamed protein product [Clonostachys solani]|uniref:Uncharacterized protein n=1 Tax=Clonostachys solani TaxID=160281 RepID=A0A9N9Z1L8_9HYPO|nr:unnamed protein product [Clonostachys solani]